MTCGNVAVLPDKKETVAAIGWVIVGPKCNKRAPIFDDKSAAAAAAVVGLEGLP